MNEIKIPDVVNVEWAREEMERTGKMSCNKYFVYYAVKSSGIEWIDLSELNKKTHRGQVCIDWLDVEDKEVLAHIQNKVYKITLNTHDKKFITAKYKGLQVCIQPTNILKVKLSSLIGYRKERKVNFENINYIDQYYKNSTIKGYYIKEIRKYNSGYTFIVDNTVTGEEETITKHVLDSLKEDRRPRSYQGNWLKGTSMEKFVVNEEDLYTNSPGGKNTVNIKCPDCEYKKKIAPYHFFKYGLNCYCNIRGSFGERVVESYLRDSGYILNDDYIREYIILNGKYRFDFYLPKENKIIEVHGLQHYEPHSFNNNTDKRESFEKVKKSDGYKKKWALKNGITYIEIDAKKSEFDYIIKNMIDSGLDFKGVNIKRIKNNFFQGQSEIIKDIKYYLEETEYSIKEISYFINIPIHTLRKIVSDLYYKNYVQERNNSIRDNFENRVVKIYSGYQHLQKTADYFNKSLETIRQILIKHNIDTGNKRLK